MSVLREYLVDRPLGALIQGGIIGVYLPISIAGLVTEKAGYVAALLLLPVWLCMMVVTIPASIVYCFVMVMAKGPLWQYPPEQRGKAIDWSKQDIGPERGNT